MDTEAIDVGNTAGCIASTTVTETPAMAPSAVALSPEVEAHKTVHTPKSILKESRIVEQEKKKQSQINKWIKGDTTVQKKPINQNLRVIEATTGENLELSTELPALASSHQSTILDSSCTRIEPQVSDFLLEDELPPIILPLHDDTASSPRKRRMAAKTVLKQEKGQSMSQSPLEKRLRTQAQEPTTKKVDKRSPRGTTGVPEVWIGIPDDKLGEGFHWTSGWLKKTYQRQSGKSAGAFDSYWFTPILKKKLRSLAEVRRFMKALELKGGNEDEAWRTMKKLPR